MIFIFQENILITLKNYIQIHGHKLNIYWINCKSQLAQHSRILGINETRTHWPKKKSEIEHSKQLFMHKIHNISLIFWYMISPR